MTAFNANRKNFDCLKQKIFVRLKDMDTFTRNVEEMNSHDRHLLENVIGRPLHEDQQLVIQVVDRKLTQASNPPEGSTADACGTSLPDWCNVYAGLSDQEIAAIEQTILKRSQLCRPPM